MKQIATINRRCRGSGMGYKIAESNATLTREFVCKHWRAAGREFTARSSLGYIWDRSTMVAKRERERERTVCAGTRSQFNLPTTRVCLAVIISGVSVNVFRAYLPPSAPKGRRIRAHSRSIATRTHTHAYTHTYTNKRMDTWRWRSRSPVRGRDRSAPLAGAVPEIISFAAKRTRTIPWPSDIEVSASNRFLLGRV